MKLREAVPGNLIRLRSSPRGVSAGGVFVFSIDFDPNVSVFSQIVATATQRKDFMLIIGTARQVRWTGADRIVDFVTVLGQHNGTPYVGLINGDWNVTIIKN